MSPLLQHHSKSLSYLPLSNSISLLCMLILNPISVSSFGDNLETTKVSSTEFFRTEIRASHSRSSKYVKKKETE